MGVGTGRQCLADADLDTGELKKLWILEQVRSIVESWVVMKKKTSTDSMAE